MAGDGDDNVANRIHLSLKKMGHPVSPDCSTAKPVRDHAKKHAATLFCNVVWRLQYRVLPEGAVTDNAFLFGAGWNKPFLLSDWVRIGIITFILYQLY